jgi:hypothetical protein
LGKLSQAGRNTFRPRLTDRSTSFANQG